MYNREKEEVEGIFDGDNIELRQLSLSRVQVTRLTPFRRKALSDPDDVTSGAEMECWRDSSHFCPIHPPLISDNDERQ